MLVCHHGCRAMCCYEAKSCISKIDLPELQNIGKSTFEWNVKIWVIASHRCGLEESGGSFWDVDMKKDVLDQRDRIIRIWIY